MVDYDGTLQSDICIYQLTRISLSLSQSLNQSVYIIVIFPSISHTPSFLSNYLSISQRLRDNPNISAGGTPTLQHVARSKKEADGKGD